MRAKLDDMIKTMKDMFKQDLQSSLDLYNKKH
jgi:hypothetical protein